MILNEKGILKEFELVVYPLPFVAVIGDLEKEVNDAYAPVDEGYTAIGKPGEGYGATTYHVRNKETSQLCCLVWVPNMEECKGSNFAHEAGHVTLEVFKYIGAHIDYEDQEPFCYLLGTIFRLMNGAFYEWKEFLEKKDKKKFKFIKK